MSHEKYETFMNYNQNILYDIFNLENHESTSDTEREDCLWNYDEEQYFDNDDEVYYSEDNEEAHYSEEEYEDHSSEEDDEDHSSVEDDHYFKSEDYLEYLSKFGWLDEEEECSSFTRNKFSSLNHPDTYFVEQDNFPSAFYFFSKKESHDVREWSHTEDDYCASEEEKEEFGYNSSKFCDICEKWGHFMRECHLYNKSQNLGKKARQRANRKNEKLLSNHIEKVDWKTIGKVNGLGKEKETLQAPKKFIKQELNEASIVEEVKCKKIVEGEKCKKIVDGNCKKIVEGNCKKTVE
ncbi:18462_t:CDS:1, partial [Acaulospora morrowiae]